MRKAIDILECMSGMIYLKSIKKSLLV